MILSEKREGDSLAEPVAPRNWTDQDRRFRVDGPFAWKRRDSFDLLLALL